MSQVYFISDLHLGHSKIAEFSGPQRGNITCEDEHDEWIVKQWNSVVRKQDLVWVLGDVCFKKEKLPFLKRMNGSKHLILGNHDEFTLDEYKPYFNKIHGFQRCHGFWLSHAPIHPNELRGKFNVHGHTHNQNVPDKRYISVCVEQVGGTPLSLDSLKCIREESK